jgi:hypothetical protein
MIKVKILKENKILNPLDDFLVEISWWQKRGIATVLDREDLKYYFNNAEVKNMHHSEMEDISNCYNSLVRGNTQEEKFESLFEAYLKDKRGPMEQRADTDDGKREYLNKLMESVINRSCPASVIVNIPEIGRFMAGGRTRAALAKVADIPMHVKNITLPTDSLLSKEMAIKALQDTTIKE